MKYLSLLPALCLVVFIANSSVAYGDDNPVRIMVSKAGDTTAKVKVESKTVTVPISFADGANWDKVKDSYNVSPALASRLEKGKAGISVAADGTASFTAAKSGKKKK